MKFGGTSVGDAAAIERLVTIVADARAEQPLVVVSAMSKITNALVALDDLIAAGDASAIEYAIAELEARHAVAADGLQLAAITQAPIGELFAALRQAAVAGLSQPSSPERRDLICGFGELLSSRLVVGAFDARRVQVEWFDARSAITTDDHFGAAIPRESEIEARAQRLLPVLTAGRVVVTQGFIGATRDGVPTTLGRGGSDFSAALFGAALGASRVEIWTDVDGLMSADPRVVPEARLLASATYDEAAELAAFGAKVLHPATQLPLVEAGIPIVIRNTFAPERPGTWIRADDGEEDALPVRSISFKPGVTVVQIRAPRMLGAYGFLRRIFEVFERHEVVVDVLATSEVSVSLTVDDVSRLDAVIRDLRLVGEVGVRAQRGVIAVVGRGIRETPGIAARVYTAIADVNVEMISQGASASNLTFIVKEADGPAVVRALHRTFFPEVA
ncbi:MAG: lysine-sensitive aspartokinase 3 [Gemmatimonadales bacterium]